MLGKRISELGLRIKGSPIESLVDQLYVELASHGLTFRPPVYFSDQWGCPEGVPIIGVPFYLGDPRLTRIEEERATEAEGALDAIQYLRHEAGHAFNYAYRLHDRPDWRQMFGPYSRPYRDRFHADPFSRSFVRHLPGWYAQKHPDEDFAECFAVWLSPDIDWRSVYEGWPVIAKLEYVERVLREVGVADPAPAPQPMPEHLPVEVMHHTVEEHYRASTEHLLIDDARVFDPDLKNIFAFGGEPSTGQAAAEFLKHHRREMIARIAYWTGEATTVVGGFMDFITRRAEDLDLRVAEVETLTLIELTSFGTAVIMNYRYTEEFDGGPRGNDS